MALPVELDLKHWTRVVPVGGKQTLKAVSFACWYANSAAPPELATEGTELAVNATVTVETPSGKWFIAKTAAAGEAQKPSLLEVASPLAPPQPEIAVPGAFKTGTAGYETEAEVKAIRDKLTTVIEAGKNLGLWS